MTGTGKGKGTADIAASSIGIPAGLPGFEGLSVATYPILESLKPSWLKTIEKELSDVKDKNLALCDLISDEQDKNKELNDENEKLRIHITTLDVIEQENYTLKVRIATLESSISTP